jgi:hypothetical protein
LWHPPELGQQKENGRFVNARIHTQSTRSFPTSPPVRPQDSPYKAAHIEYGQKVQLAKEKDTSPKLSPDKIKHIQQIVGTLLYYLRAVDPTLAAALSTIVAQQSNGTQAVMDACKQLLDYITMTPMQPSIFAQVT